MKCVVCVFDSDKEKDAPAVYTFEGHSMCKQHMMERRDMIVNAAQQQAGHPNGLHVPGR